MPGPAFLENDRVALRTIEEEDFEFLQEAITDSQVREPIGGLLPPILNNSIESAECKR